MRLSLLDPIDNTMSPISHAFPPFNGQVGLAPERSRNRAFAFQTVRARHGTANGPMSGLHPSTDSASLTTPALWRFLATTKTGNADRQQNGPLYGCLTVEQDVMRAVGLGWLKVAEYKSGASGLSYA